ncbi:MAG TPA: hypothetical protein PLD02_00225 [Saprospiraceae bacterium]|nr:hypothetical protein [Saprospiraceae bacterium]
MTEENLDKTKDSENVEETPKPVTKIVPKAKGSNLTHPGFNHNKNISKFKGPNFSQKRGGGNKNMASGKKGK